MKKTLKVYTRKNADQDYVDRFEIIDKLPEVGDYWNGLQETVVSIKQVTDGRFDVPSGVWGYRLYTITTQDKPVFEDDEPSFNTYDVAIETYISMDQFIENLFGELYDKPQQIDIETAKTDVNNFYHEDWYLPKDLTAESYMEAWNERVRKAGESDDN